MWRRGFLNLAAAAVSSTRTRRFQEAFDFIRGATPNGGLLVLHRGRLVFERYFGKGHPEAAANLASVGKSVTSVAVGILLGLRRDLYPHGLEEPVWAGFPLTDPRKSKIRLGELLAMTAGIRGNNPGIARGRQSRLDPAGPDGWEAMVDEVALGLRPAAGGLSTETLWCDPGAGWSYATSSVHLASMVLRRATGRELASFVAEHLAKPLGWRRWGWGYRNRPLAHTPGGGGIVLRARDLARFGEMLRAGGRWRGRRIVPEDFVRHCGAPSPFNPHTPYSLQFHVNRQRSIPGAPPDAFWKPGSGGHCLYVVPSLDLVVVKLGGRDEQFDPANTGLPAAPESTRVDPAWSPRVDAETAVARTLELVTSAWTREPPA